MVALAGRKISIRDCTRKTPVQIKTSSFTAGVINPRQSNPTRGAKVELIFAVYGGATFSVKREFSVGVGLQPGQHSWFSRSYSYWVPHVPVLHVGSYYSVSSALFLCAPCVTSSVFLLFQFFCSIQLLPRKIKQRSCQQHKHKRPKQIIRRQSAQYLRPERKQIRPPRQSHHRRNPWRLPIRNFRVLQQSDYDPQQPEYPS